ncbi:MAG: ribosome biogenesis GTPase Der [Planctomycetes bacterium]|nr:ribosome biogenesis GTPase Der [Planctomycetota bacterium]
MGLPVVAVIDRPNVGKSSLLNCLVGKRISIVAPRPGITRDRVATPLPVGEGYVELVDTGGLGIDDVDNLTDHVESQIRYAMTAAALILFVVDVRDGVLPLDTKVAELLRHVDRPVVLVANKCDSQALEDQTGEFAGLGFGEAIAVSALHGRGRNRLLAAITEAIGDRAEDVAVPVMKLAIVGKRNVGKSTFVNALAGEDRVIVSETPGTTRDSVDVRFQLDDSEFVAIDTAGIRKKAKFSDDVEYFGFHRAQRSIRRADVVALLFDATETVGQVEKQLASYIMDQFKPVILVINKWDLVGGEATQDDYRKYLDKMLPHLPFAPISFIAATQRTNIAGTVRLAQDLFKQADMRVSTGQLNRVVEEVFSLRGPSHKQGTKIPKVLYATQVATCPPTLVLFVNSMESFTSTYQRFLLNALRDRLPFPEVPFRLVLRPRQSGKSKPAKPESGVGQPEDDIGL